MVAKSSNSPLRFFKNFSFLLGARIIDSMAQLAVLPLVSRYLGSEKYGDYGFVMICCFITVCFTYAGLERIVLREIAKNPKQADEYLTNALIIRWFYMLVSLAVITVIILLGNFSAKLIWCLYLAAFAWSFASDSAIHISLYKAFEKMEYEAILVLSFQISYLVFLFLVTYYNLGFTSIFIAFLIANMMKNFSAVLITRIKFTKFTFKIQWSLLKYFLKESYILGLIVILMQGFINVDLLVLKSSRMSVAASMFYSSHNLIILISVTATSVMSVLSPIFSRSANTDHNDLFGKYKQSFKIVTFVTFLLVIQFMILSPLIIKTIFGSEFVNAIHSFQILVICLIFTIPFTLFDIVLVSISKQHLLFLCPLAGLIVRFVLDIFLIPTYGVVGASVAAVSGYFVFFITGFYLITVNLKQLDIHKIMLKPAIISLIIGIIVYQLRESLPIYYLAVPATIGYFAFLYWIKFFSNDEIVFLKDFTHKALPTVFISQQIKKV